MPVGILRHNAQAPWLLVPASRLVVSQVVGRAAFGAALLGAAGLSCGGRATAVERTDTRNPEVGPKPVQVVENEGDQSVRVTPGGKASTATETDEAKGLSEDEVSVPVPAMTADKSNEMMSSPPAEPSSSPVNCKTRVDGPATAVGPQPICSDIQREVDCHTNKSSTEASGVCKVDSDCVLVNTAPSCLDPCGMRAAVSVSGAEAVQRGIESNGMRCRRFEQLGCHYIASPCLSPPEGVARCSEGLCVEREAEKSLAGESCDPRVGCVNTGSLSCVAKSCLATGTCKEAGPVGCGESDAPVCGCDGVIYGNECQLHGAPVAYDGECFPLDGIDRGAATPKPGVTKLLLLLNGDTITTPVDFEFEPFPPSDSLDGVVRGSNGEKILVLESCFGSHSPSGVEAGAVNVKFSIRDAQGDYGPLATFPSRSTYLAFVKGTTTEAALQIASTYTALGRPCSTVD